MKITMPIVQLRFFTFNLFRTIFTSRVSTLRGGGCSFFDFLLGGGVAVAAAGVVTVVVTDVLDAAVATAGLSAGTCGELFVTGALVSTVATDGVAEGCSAGAVTEAGAAAAAAAGVVAAGGAVAAAGAAAGWTAEIDSDDSD